MLKAGASVNHPHLEFIDESGWGSKKWVGHQYEKFGPIPQLADFCSNSFLLNILLLNYSKIPGYKQAHQCGAKTL